jgi:hypothetical protein
MKTTAKAATTPIGANLELFDGLKEFGATPPTPQKTNAEIIHGYCGLSRIETTPEARRVLKWAHYASSQQGATRIGKNDTGNHWFLWNHKGQWYRFTAHLDHVTVEKSEQPLKFMALPKEQQESIKRLMACLKAHD